MLRSSCPRIVYRFARSLVDLRASLNVRATLRQHHQLRFRDVQVPDQEFTLGAQQADREGRRAAARMCLLPRATRAQP